MHGRRVRCLGGRSSIAATAVVFIRRNEECDDYDRRFATARLRLRWR